MSRVDVMMHGVRRVLCRLETHVLIFVAFLALYLWPLVSTVGQGRPALVFIYYYVCFAFNIVAVALVALSSGTQPPRTERKGHGGD